MRLNYGLKYWNAGLAGRPFLSRETNVNWKNVKMRFCRPITYAFSRSPGKEWKSVPCLSFRRVEVRTSNGFLALSLFRRVISRGCLIFLNFPLSVQPEEEMGRCPLGTSKEEPSSPTPGKMSPKKWINYGQRILPRFTLWSLALCNGAWSQEEICAFLRPFPHETSVLECRPYSVVCKRTVPFFALCLKGKSTGSHIYSK